MSDFETFWRAYPRRVGKGRARTAFAKAIRKTTLETMLAAIEAYKRHKPAYQDFCHPSTWLNDERWDDEWEENAAPQQPRNAGERAFLKLRSENANDTTDTASRRLDTGDGRRQIEGTGDVVPFARAQGAV